MAERHDLAGRQHHVLLGRCAADGRFVHPDQRADLGSGQRHQVLDAVLQVVTLPIDEALGDALQRGAPAVDVVDEEARPAHVLANVLAVRLGGLAASHAGGEPRVGGVDSQGEAARLDHLDASARRRCP